jgi:hypothetical protein
MNSNTNEQATNMNCYDLEDAGQAYWLDDGKCDECGLALVRYAVEDSVAPEPEYSVWFDKDTGDIHEC